MRSGVLHRRKGLIITAVDIIEELSNQGLSIREITKKQNLSMTTLFKHFSGKNNLLIAVLNHFSRFNDDIYQSTLFNKLSPRDSIKYFITAHMEYYKNYHGPGYFCSGEQITV